MRLRKIGLGGQGGTQVDLGIFKSVAVLTQQATNEQELCRQRRRVAVDQRIGIAHITRVAMGHGQLKVQSGQGRHGLCILRGAVNGLLVLLEAAGIRVASLDSQSLQHLAGVTWRSRGRPAYAGNATQGKPGQPSG